MSKSLKSFNSDWLMGLQEQKDIDLVEKTFHMEGYSANGF